MVTDIHSDEDFVDYFINKYRPDVVLDCGDHTEDESFYSSKKIPWYFVNGNHENNKIIEEMRFGYRKINNLYLINPGDVVNINGVNIAGFGGNFSDKVFYNKGKKKKNPLLKITKEDVNAMGRINNKLVDILLMHESSKELWEGTGFNYGQEVNSKIVKMFSNLKYVFSGHYHEPMRREFYSSNGKKLLRTEVSLNMARSGSYILLEGSNRDVEITKLVNRGSSYNILLNSYLKKFGTENSNVSNLFDIKSDYLDFNSSLDGVDSKNKLILDFINYLTSLDSDISNNELKNNKFKKF